MRQADAGAVAPLWLAVPARPGQLAGLRRALREWMSQAGVGEREATNVQLAVGEAATNVVEHAYLGGEPGLIRVAATCTREGVLAVQVMDTGSWREQTHQPGQGGRGIALMRASMDDIDVLVTQAGTTVLMYRRVRPDGNEAGADL